MAQNVFNKKSQERISSPDQLNDYIRVSTPGIWIVMCAIIALLAGVCIWGVFGKMETVQSATAICSDGKVTCYIDETARSAVKEGQQVKIDGKFLTIESISSAPIEVDDSFDAYALHISGLAVGSWVYAAELSGETLKDGAYTANIITDSVSPASFLAN